MPTAMIPGLYLCTSETGSGGTVRAAGSLERWALE